jgi:hypothetical protein
MDSWGALGRRPNSGTVAVEIRLAEWRDRSLRANRVPTRLHPGPKGIALRVPESAQLSPRTGTSTTRTQALPGPTPRGSLVQSQRVAGPLCGNRESGFSNDRDPPPKWEASLVLWSWSPQGDESRAGTEPQRQAGTPDLRPRALKERSRGLPRGRSDSPDPAPPGNDSR